MGTIYERLGGTCQFEKAQQRARAFDRILFPKDYQLSSAKN
jgi:hypothetical protein